MNIRQFVRNGAALAIAFGAVAIAAKSAQAVTCPQTLNSWDTNNDFSAGVVSCTSASGKNGTARGYTDVNGKHIQAWGDISACDLWEGTGLNSSQGFVCFIRSTSGNTVQADCGSSAVHVKVDRSTCPH